MDEIDWHKVADLRAIEIDRLRAENEALRADVVWAVKQGAVSWRNDMLTYSKAAIPIPYIRHDGTPADILRAVREARNGV